MANVLEYILNLGGNLDEKLRRIIIYNDQQLGSWARVQLRVQAAERTMNNMGRSIGSLHEKAGALRAQREWIPAENRAAIRQSNREIRELERQIRNLENMNGGRLKAWFGDLGRGIPALNMLRNPVQAVAAGIHKVTQYVDQSREAYKLRTEAETKLAAAMRNTMGAGAEETDAILAVIAAQRKLGVIGDQVQMAGAEELSSHLTKKESLEKLIPAMNDVLARQYGLNASQDKARSVAAALGEAMNGQVDVLSRYGCEFDETQKKIMKNGDESQRLATLIEVASASAGGMNAALAATPEGKLQRLANDAGELQSRVGRLAGLAQSAFAPATEKIQSLFEKVVMFFEAHSDGIMSVATAAATAAAAAFSALGATIKFTWDVLKGLLSVLKWVSPILIGIAAYLTVVHFKFLSFVVQFYLYTTWTKIAATATKVWTAAQAAFNAVMNASPMGLVVAAIAALVAVIAYVVQSTEGWGATWSNIMTWMSLGFELFKEGCVLKWLQIKNIFLTGFETIKKAWYKLQSLWDEEGAKRGLAEMEAGRNKRAEEILEARNKVSEISGKMANMKVWEVRSKEKNDDLAGGLTNVPGTIPSTNERVQTAVFAAGGGDGNDLSTNENGSASSIGGYNDAIAAGGQRNKTINISIGDLIGEMTFNGGFAENRENFKHDVARAIMQALGMAETAAG